jgi:hypothetical protein
LACEKTHVVLIECASHMLFFNSINRKPYASRTHVTLIYRLYEIPYELIFRNFYPFL